MKNKSFFIKSIALFLAVISMVFSFTACDFRPEPPDEDAFSLVIDFAQTMVKVGDKVTYKAILKNSEDESYTLQHTLKPIYISVVKSEDYSKEKVVYSSYAETDIAPHGQIEEFCEFKPSEKGEYILYAFADFSIEGKDTTKDYEYECEKITITVV